MLAFVTSETIKLHRPWQLHNTNDKIHQTCRPSLTVTDIWCDTHAHHARVHTHTHTYGQTLSEQDVIKVLGLHLDRHLSWETHLNCLLSKLGTICFIMRKLSHVLNIESMRVVYFAHFQSVILYGFIFGEFPPIWKGYSCFKKW
jgi:hypothetical protein